MAEKVLVITARDSYPVEGLRSFKCHMRKVSLINNSRRKTLQSTLFLAHQCGPSFTERLRCDSGLFSWIMQLFSVMCGPISKWDQTD